MKRQLKVILEGEDVSAEIRTQDVADVAIPGRRVCARA
jgi:hypothetical protein